MEATKPREVKPWLRRAIEAAGALGAITLILWQQNEGNRMALNLNILLSPFCCHDVPVCWGSVEDWLNAAALNGGMKSN